MLPDNIELLPHSTLSLYLHVPFCSRKCGYCDFYSISGAHEALVRRTIEDALLSIEETFAALSHAGAPPDVPSIFIGGGTPSVVPLNLFDTIFRRIFSHLTNPPAELTVEVNPETLTDETLQVFERNGVTRISLGIQSFAPAVLKYLDRTSTQKKNEESLGLLDERWKSAFNADLITGIPGQTVKSAIKDVEILLEYRPDHVSLYTLTVEEGTPLAAAIAAGEKPAVDPETQSDIWRECATALQSAGYDWYEISNFALPGNECRHNLGYWHLEPYLGVGPAAASTIGTTAGPLRIDASRTLPIPHYNSEIIAPDDFYLEHLMMELRLSSGIQRHRLKTVFGADPCEIAPETIRKSVARGLIEVNDETIRCTPEGRLVLDSILVQFAGEIDAAGQRAGRNALSRCTWP